MRNRASCYPILSRVAAITLAWLRALSLGLLGVMLVSTPAEAKPFAYVTNYNFVGTGSVIDTATNTVVATIGVGSFPLSVAVTPNGQRAYVTNQSSNNVSVIDTATNAVMATVPVGLAPQGVAITPDGKLAYVANGGAAGFVTNTVSVIDTATNSVVATVTVGDHPFGVAVTPDGKRAYVTSGSSNIQPV